ncbi:hypothetical protein GBA63_01150 [Rubrobacter tropicus]|uniref:GH29D-like beta-sandwich domain-containing protein n=1 Tax=Rubrobacter tropicus TaxID=2653851 RepID=A0A6G8Q4J0_9ACTN|nr:chitobiase/beta-hexosaminidase C-terminal domain-containing protein [Rubrobacter tropicus]QIN81385.1 hypothetical protein GBA63_01150 [Rubrobacter tropicus]
MTIEGKGGRGGMLKGVIVAALLAAVLAAGVLAGSASAADQVQAGRTIEAFTGTDLVDLQGYPANADVTVEVIRSGVLVGRVGGTTDDTGFVEFNHAGGGQVPAGDCFQPNATPDIRAGDVIRTRTAGDPAGVFDSAVARDIGVNFATITTNTTNNTITISGHVRSRPDAVVVPGTDVLELRLNKANRNNNWDSNGRRDLRVDIGANVGANGLWTRVLRVSHDDALDWRANPGEVSLEWSTAAAGEEEAAPPAIFVADEGGGEAIVGCPPVAEYAVKGASHRVINKSFVDGTSDLVLTGTSFNAQAVTVRLNNRISADAVISTQPSGHQTWRAVFTNAQVSGLADGAITAGATYTVDRDVTGANVTPTNFAGTLLTLRKDTVAPAAKPVARPEPGVYNRPVSVFLKAPAGTKVRYTVGGGAPTINSQLYTGPIRVTGTQTIRAAAFDPAGNRGPVGFFRYRIR